jgi:hypothetical protein
MPLASKRLLSMLFALACSAGAGAADIRQPATVRLDYTHSGNALSEQYAIERVLIEPLPWPGDLSQPFDNTNRGNNRLEVADAKTGDLLYSRDFSTVFGEWRTTEEANKLSRGFHESVGTCTNETNLGDSTRDGY